MEWEALFGMFIGFCLVVVVPIVAILTSHQRKMAEMMRGQSHQNLQPNQHLEARLQHMQVEINELRARLAQHVIETDDQHNLRQRFDAPPPTPVNLDR